MRWLVSPLSKRGGDSFEFSWWIISIGYSRRHRAGEARSTILNAGRTSGVEAAELLLGAAVRNGPEDIRARLEFLEPAIQLAKTGDEQALARLPEREFAAAKKIAAALLER